MTFIKVILIIIICYWGLKLFFRLVFPLLLVGLMKFVSKQFEKQMNIPNDNNSSKTADETKKSRKAYKGEYVDYEEIK